MTIIKDIQAITSGAGTGAVVLGGLFDSFFGRRGTVDAISNPSKFSSIVLSKHNGLATTNRAMMFITTPKCFQGANQIAPGENKVVPMVSGVNQSPNFNRNPADLIIDLPFFCSGSTIPGMSLDTQAFYQHGYGAVHQTPIGQRFDDVDAVFYCDGSGAVFNFFHKWMQNIVNYNSTTAMAGGSYKGAYPFEFFYKDEYATTIQIIVYNHQSDVVVVYELRDAFPAVISPTSVNWDQDDQIMLLPVTFKYTSWNSNTLYQNDAGESSRNMTFAERLIRTGTALQMISGLIKKPTSIADIVNIITAGTLLKRGNII